MDPLEEEKRCLVHDFNKSEKDIFNPDLKSRTNDALLTILLLYIKVIAAFGKF
jgi:hypothetical protein